MPEQKEPEKKEEKERRENDQVAKPYPPKRERVINKYERER